MALKLAPLPGAPQVNPQALDLTAARPGDVVVLTQELRTVPLADFLKLARDPKLHTTLVGEVVEDKAE